MPESKARPRHLLVARFSALGDVAMTIPVLYSVCESNPDTTFYFVTRESMTSMFVNAPSNLVVRGIDLNSYPHVTDLWKLTKQLIAEYVIDGFADLHDVLRTKIMRMVCRVNGIPCHAIRKGRSNKRALTRRYNKVLIPLVSSRARYREVFLHFGYEINHTFRGLFGSGKGSPELFSDITPAKKPGEIWIGIAPFAKHKGKIYPVELMEQVVGTLSSRNGTRIFLFGGGAEENRVFDAWCGKYPNLVNLAAKRYGFARELALTSNLDVMVSMDSANIHLASLVGVRVVSVWGATHPYCGFKGYGQKDSDMVQLLFTCRPCSVFGNKPCLTGDYRCLTSIKPAMIINKVDEILAENDK